MKNMKHLSFGDSFFVPGLGWAKPMTVTVAKVGRVYITTTCGHRFIINKAIEDSYPNRMAFDNEAAYHDYLWKKKALFDIACRLRNVNPSGLSAERIHDLVNILKSMEGE